MEVIEDIINFYFGKRFHRLWQAYKELHILSGPIVSIPKTVFLYIKSHPPIFGVS